MDKIWLVFGNHSDAHLLASLAASKQYGDPHALAPNRQVQGAKFYVYVKGRTLITLCLISALGSAIQVGIFLQI
jgi:hypothetical protein